MPVTRFLFWLITAILVFTLSTHYLYGELSEPPLTIVLDTQSLDCTEPKPSRDSVEAGLSFTQTRTCKALVDPQQSRARHCFTHQEQVVCLDGKISITLSQTDVGIKPVKGDAT
jgi:hypothetical protein